MLATSATLTKSIKASCNGTQIVMFVSNKRLFNQIEEGDMGVLYYKGNHLVKFEKLPDFK